MPSSLERRLYHKVKDHMGWTHVKTNQWFFTKNPHLGNLSPDDMLSFNPEKLEKWIDALILENTPPEPPKETSER